MENNIWQIETLEQVKDLLQSLDGVQAAVVVGSFANEAVQPDFWSDLDLVIVVSDDTIDQIYADTDWLKPIDYVYATSRSQATPRYTLRVCFRDMRRLDLVFIPATAFENPGCWADNPFQAGFRILFSRSTAVDEFLSQEFTVVPGNHDPDMQFLTMNNDFWFKGMLAVYKVVRADLLIALHLTLDLVRDCLMLRMMLRDRKAGTCHHRIGGVGNELVTQMEVPSSGFSSAGILEMIENYSQLYDDLAKEWSSVYQAKRFPLLDWITQARKHLVSSDSQIRS